MYFNQMKIIINAFKFSVNFGNNRKHVSSGKEIIKKEQNFFEWETFFRKTIYYII